MNDTASRAGDAEVAIILPVFNDEEWIASALASCIGQTLAEIEIIVVDDASTDATVSIVEQYQARDPRIRLIRQPENRTAFQARRVGIAAASAPYVLFLDGDDELLPDAAASTLSLARTETADVVGFASEVVKPDGTTGGGFQNSMKPRHVELTGDEIINKLYPVGQIAQGQLWRYLFERRLLTSAYASLPETLTLPRANDLPIAFLALMHASRYVSTSTALHRYYFRRGASGHQVSRINDYRFIASSIDSIDAIKQSVYQEADARAEGDSLRAAYDSTRLSVTGSVLEYVRDMVDLDLQNQCLNDLVRRVGLATLAAASADFAPKALPLLGSVVAPLSLANRPARHIVLRSTNLGTGGAQGVVVTQARHLTEAGFVVTIAVDSAPDTKFALPPGVQVFRITGLSMGQRITNFTAFCEDRNVEVVIDHYVLYNTRWPFFAIAAAEFEIPTIGWIHNFALRPVLDASGRLPFLDQFFPLLATLVVLSEADVAYWKLRGMPDVVYIPNPASPLLETLEIGRSPREAPIDRLELVWWGRLQQSTKQVRELITIASALRGLGVDFRVTVIGPDGPDLKAKQLHELADAHGVGDALETLGSLHGEELVSAVAHAHIFVSTSIIEGYPLALVEAQALGLPILMYDLPWLATIPGNTGLLTVPQGDARGAARALAALASDPDRYESMSLGALDAARRALAHDFRALYSDLVYGRLAPEHSPEPSHASMSLLLEQNTLFNERSVRRERRALDRARLDADKLREKADRLGRDLDDVRKRLSAQQDLVTSADGFRSNVPSVPRKGPKGWIQRFLPVTMRQSGFYARHQHQVITQQYDQIVKNQAAVNDHLARVASTLVGSQRRMQKEIGSASDRISRVGMEIETVSQRLRPLEQGLVDLNGNLEQRLSRISSESTEHQRSADGEETVH